MKKWSTIAAVVVFAIFAVADLVHDFVTNDPIGYFSTEPRRLLYVAGIAITGGLVALMFSRFSRQAKRRVRLFGWGAGASFLTAFCGYLLYQSVSLSPMIVANSGAGWLVLVPLLFASIAAYLWFEFFRAWKRHEPKIHHDT
jgi:hypothetical protein